MQSSGYVFGVGRKNDLAYGMPRKGLGPVVWCKKCSRRHRRRAVCHLFLRTRNATSGNTVKRWAH